MTLPDPELDGYAPAARALAAEAWPMKAEEEARSAAVYRALGAAATEDDWPAELLAAFAAAEADEERHALLCADVGRRMGARAPVRDLLRVEARVAALPAPRARGLALLLVEIAIGETLSARLFQRARAGAREPCTRAALDAIFTDEARHAALGWSALAALQLDDADRAFLAGEARTQLGVLERALALPALRRLEAGVPFDPELAALGVLAPEDRVEAFYAGVDLVVGHRLPALGLDGAAAWRDRHR